MVRSDARAYHQRNRVLFQLGFLSYDQYLRSPLWGRIRTQQLREHPNCYGCGCKAEEVHHGNYRRETLAGTSNRGLYSVCERCHRTAEFLPGFGKVGPAQATQRLKAIRAGRLDQADEDLQRKKARQNRERRERRELAEIEGQWANRYSHLMADDEEAEEAC